MQYFFRGVEDGFNMPWYGTVHLCIIALWLIGMACIAIFRNKIDARLLKCFIVALLVDQIILYTWQFGSGYFNVQISLPLYHCRVGIWLLIIGFFGKQSWAKAVGIYWAILGTVLALLIPDAYNFKFPHYTNFQFFFAHILLGYIVIYYVAVENYSFPKTDLKFVLIFSNMFNVCIACVDLLLRPTQPIVNYGYLYEAPKALRAVLDFPVYIYMPIAFVMYNVVTIIIWLIGKGLYKLISKRKLNQKCIN